MKDLWLAAQVSLKFFTKKFLRMMWPIHYQEWADMIQKYDRCLIQAPRGHGKSHFWSIAYPLWRVIRGKREILLISYSEDQCRKLIRDLRQTVEGNEFLAPLRPTTKEIWGTDQLSFANGSFISGLGFGTSSRGRHPDDIIVDDPLKDLGGMTDEDQERAYFGVITGMAMEHTKLVTVGTPVNFGDLLEKLEANDAYAKWKRPAIAEGKPLFPELWNLKTLNTKRQEMGSLNFAREYLLQRVDPATQPFKRQYETFYTELPLRWARKVTFCDPAYSENSGDYTAIVTVGFTHGNQAYVLEAKGIRREDPGKVVAELVKTVIAQKPDVLGVEKRKGQAIEYSLREAIARYKLFDFKYVELGHQGHAKWSDTRIGGMVARWEARSIHIHPEMMLLRAQLYAYRADDKSKEHDDLVDALAYCFHPDLVRPNAGQQNVPLSSDDASIEGKPRYQVAQDMGWQPKEVLEWVSTKKDYGPSMARRLDRRVMEAV